ncbi:MAG: type II toxin-antitoxin system VapC family toxin [Candidatus Saganbacteria bacterium]|nr:type II toxin-antitoxin system VapC family toxin [Candidatus Saganbacteria bacterium]
MKKRKSKYVLDTFAVLTYLKEEPGWEKVRKVIWNAYNNKDLQVFFNYVNLGELYYIVYRENGAVIADKIVSIIKQWPIRFIGVRSDMALIAGRMKAENRISYADAYAIATALTQKAMVITGDLEFKSVEDIIDIEWLPKNR